MQALYLNSAGSGGQLSLSDSSAQAPSPAATTQTYSGFEEPYDPAYLIDGKIVFQSELKQHQVSLERIQYTLPYTKIFTSAPISRIRTQSPIKNVSAHAAHAVHSIIEIKDES